MKSASNRCGMTLIELLVVIAVLGILAAALIPSGSSGAHEQLRAAAQILVSDLAYARSLAVGSNSKYKVTFDFVKNQYILEHSGSNPALERLPNSPFRHPDDPDHQYIVRLEELARGGSRVRLAAVGRGASGEQPATRVEFDAYGATTSATPTVIWLAVGAGGDRNYIAVQVNPVTGLAVAGEITAAKPPPSIIALEAAD
ncbi:MAG: pilus assembly FimT family protein [Planctomycetota bacterium]